jgi:undecaprenyl diphosphate synthase
MEQTKLPTCLGFIMDGNRRFAKEQGLETFEGHKQGGDVLLSCVHWLRDTGISHGVFYAFSTENWNRSEVEVSYLMDLFRTWLKNIETELVTAADDKKVRVRIIGRRTDFAEDIQIQMNELEAASQEFEVKTTIWIALSYGGRAEIIEAVNKAIKNGEDVTEKDFESLLWTANMPDPDMIIRTSGEQRLSNFLTWRSVYSELYFMEKHWPALSQSDFEAILIEYEKRERRRGKE